MFFDYLLSTDRFDDPDEDDGADESDDEARQVKSGHGRTTTEHLEQPTAQKCTNDTDYDVHAQSLLGIGTHDHRSYPTHYRTEHDPKKYIHTISMASIGQRVNDWDMPYGTSAIHNTYKKKRGPP
ncbi:MAG: hypothetical protein A3A33_05180 [Candidatus Yanofskybacteria bacterium RIFCSPLOWO2_01_FULL_49_25]|uniref:Uncharacterized protein n=1 Tax=Candidatus Yanofskybacteria bacterium RIFCSPLOWO2_01_FULL_49_25 TaxID=1802701 RepID=A0A1F8GSI1_9BACT|nr:MAG: hypothetical protein A3A33_05180 [Candidatus Yanofskybacteria bacterium RIFCSPLOWO2_01_FULL_49_25]